MLAHLATFAGTPCHFASDDGARLYDLSRLRRLPHEFDLIVYNFRVNGADAQFRMNVCADVNAPCEAGAHPAVLISEGRCAPLARLESEVVRERTGGIVRSTTRPLGLVVEYGDGTPCDAQGTPSVVRLQLDCDEGVGGLQLVGVERDALCEWTAHARSAAACPLKAAARFRVRRPKLTECGLLYWDMAADMKAARDFASFDGSSAGSTMATAAA